MTAIPNQVGGKSFLLDLGANASCDSDTLFQFGVMGSVAAEHLLGIERPKISLLNMGEEDIKGSDVVRNAAAGLSQCEGLNYNGFIEGNHLFSGRSDVIVCDGFVGNIALKSCEGLATFIIEQMRDAEFSLALSFFLQVSATTYPQVLGQAEARPLQRSKFDRIAPCGY